MQDRLKKYRKKSLKNVDPRQTFEKIKYLSKKRENKRMKKSWLDEHQRGDIFGEIAEVNEEEEKSLMGSRKRGIEDSRRS